MLDIFFLCDLQKSAIESDLEALKQAVQGDNAEDIKAKTDALMQSSMKLGEALYKAQQEAAAAGGSPDGEAQESDNVVDAEFEEVKDDSQKKA